MSVIDTDIFRLPQECLEMIIEKLDKWSLLRLCQTCVHLRVNIYNEKLWNTFVDTIFMDYVKQLPYSRYYCVINSIRIVFHKGWFMYRLNDVEFTHLYKSKNMTISHNAKYVLLSCKCGKKKICLVEQGEMLVHGPYKKIHKVSVKNDKAYCEGKIINIELSHATHEPSDLLLPCGVLMNLNMFDEC